MMKALLIEVFWAPSRASHSYAKLVAKSCEKAENQLAQRYNKLMAMKGLSAALSPADVKML